MSAHDVSRHLFNPGNHYSGLRMQQGRVVLDSDINEARMIDDEEQRALVVDVVGPHGSPDSGFTITNVNTVGTYDFDIRAGTYYLGGYRHEIAGAGPLDPQTFRAQTNWLQSSRNDEDPILPVVPSAPRHDFVYLVGWEQGVSVVEDSELREQAIAGHDTGYRIRRMHRVHARETRSATCKGAFALFVEELTVAGAHTFDRANYELKSGARMTVVADPITTADDLCTPPVLQGFSGAENQAIRVQLVRPDRFLWSLDNASPLHRVTAAVDDDLTTLTLLTTPRDHAHIPIVGQIVELLPWGAALPNGEYVADHEISAQLGGGVLARVLTPYNPATGTITVSPESNTALGELLEWFVTASISEGDRYLFARIWNPGDNAPAAQFGLDFVAGQAIALQGTGLKVQFSSVGIVGDHWIIGARPSTPKHVVPWDLALGAAPHGPRRFYSPLALLHWTIEDGEAQVDVHSCRPTFRPLTRLRGCCTVTVGDGSTSFGDFTSINEAVRAIPLDEPGKVCILPGEYRERVVLEDRENLIIEGCGARTLLRTPEDNATSAGVLTIARCTGVTVRNMQIDAVGQFGVMILGGLASTSFVYCREILLENLNIATHRDATLDPPTIDELWVSTGSSAFPLSAVAVYFTQRIKIIGCKLTMAGTLSSAAGLVFNQVSYGLIRDCKILTQTSFWMTSRAWGGIQLVGGSDITLEGNEISTGLGHGITLGSIYYRDITSFDYTGYFDTTGRLVIADNEDCPNVAGDLPLAALPPGSDVEAEVRFSPAPSKLRIIGNRIHSMGGSGIAVIGFGPDTAVDPYDHAWMVEATDLVVADNVIEDNYRRPADQPLLESMSHMVAYGGIVLGIADGLRIHDNRIQRNGRDHRRPVCGIFVYHGEDIAVDNNFIDDNGPRVEGTGLSGNRAGIALQFVGRRVSATSGDYEVDPDNLMPAARVRGNVVHQPAGRALQIYGLGAIFVQGNSLVSEGLADLESPTLAHCIEIQNIGQSPEIGLEGVIPANLGYLPAPPLPQAPLPVADDLVDGRILFTDNQVHFKPVASAAVGISWSVRLQSYGDVAVLNNQFLVTFPIEGGSIDTDTSITAWSTRTNNNRWEDPIGVITTGVYQTDVSASTLARMNITALNQASRCIHVTISPNTPVIGSNPVDDNQTYTTCPDPGFGSLLA